MMKHSNKINEYRIIMKETIDLIKSMSLKSREDIHIFNDDVKNTKTRNN